MNGAEQFTKTSHGIVITLLGVYVVEKDYQVVFEFAVKTAVRWYGVAYLFYSAFMHTVQNRQTFYYLFLKKRLVGDFGKVFLPFGVGKDEGFGDVSSLRNAVVGNLYVIILLYLREQICLFFCHGSPLARNIISEKVKKSTVG